MADTALAEKAQCLLRLHAGPELLVLPNVWDAASARLVAQAGFPAIATSSGAMAFSLGYPDGERISREEMMAAVARVARAVAVPVSADLEAGYGDDEAAMTATARALVAAGAVGLNLEDGTGRPEEPLAPVERQVEKIRAIRRASDALGVPIVINARTDVYLDRVGEPAGRFDHTIRRLRAYRAAGADCLFAPLVPDAETIGRLVRSVEGPLNILAWPGMPPPAELQRLGVRRLSFGSWPARAALGLFARFARELRERGAFDALGDHAIPHAEMNRLMA